MTKDHQSVIDESPTLYKGVMERAVTGEAAPRQAIKAFCLRCVGYLRAEVAGCTAFKCPLHKYRPYQAGENDETLAEGSEPAS